MPTLKSVPPDSTNGVIAARRRACRSRTAALGRQDDRGKALAWDAPVRVTDRDRPVGERGDVGRSDRGFHRGIDLVEVRGADVPLQRRDVRLVGGVEAEARRHAPAHSGVRAPGALQRDVVGVDEDVDRGQVGHGRTPWGTKTVAQSSFMLTTVQPCSAAAASDFSAPFV